MHFNDLDYFFSFQKEEKMLKEHLAKDLIFYNFNSDKWKIDLSQNVDEGGQFEYSDIGIVNNDTKETIGGWSDYIATTDGKELYVFFDEFYGEEKVFKKYHIKQKTTFGVPIHIQKQFSDKLRQEIIDETYCGSTSFFKSSYSNDIIKKMLGEKSEYYKLASSFLKEQREHIPYEERFAKFQAYASFNEWIKKGKETLLKEFLFEYCIDSKKTKFIKYDRQIGRFLIIDSNKNILEYWQLSEEDFDRYVQENNYEKLDEEYFNLYFGLISRT